jgi:hypothetical protein
MEQSHDTVFTHDTPATVGDGVDETPLHSRNALPLNVSALLLVARVNTALRHLVVSTCQGILRTAETQISISRQTLFCV